MADGNEDSFDEVIVSCPLGWLKVNKEAFSPALPTRLSEAIDNLRYAMCLSSLATYISLLVIVVMAA